MAKEYQDADNTPSQGRSEAETYIEAKSGAKFSIHIDGDHRLGYTGRAIDYQVEVDGTTVERRNISSMPVFGFVLHHDGVSYSKGNSTYEFRPFVFALVDVGE